MAGCPDENEIVAFAEGRLPPGAVHAVEQHLDGCPACRELVAGLVQSSPTEPNPRFASLPPRVLSGVTLAEGGPNAISVPTLPVAGSPRVVVSGVTEPPSFDSNSTEFDERFLALPRPGARLADRFRIVRWLGRGGMGVVFEAFDEMLHEAVALKLLAPEIADEPEYLQQLRSEVALGRRVTHPNVCRLHDLGTSGAMHFVTMELVRGQTLEQRIQRDGVGLEAAVLILEQIALGLAAAHAEGVVHRDIKPRNVMVEPSGRVKVMDFGLARDSFGEASASGRRIGSPGYWAPEQERGDHATFAADLYSFGVVGCRLLAHAFPNRLTGELPPGVADIYRPLLAACVQPDPALRSVTAAEAAQIVAHHRAGRSQLQHSLVVAGALLAVVPALALAWVVSRSRSEPPPVAAPVESAASPDAGSTSSQTPSPPVQ